jgi:hypothetical protein
MSEPALTETIDKSTWPAGPWMEEPDREQWQHAGYACLVHRGPPGVWCGYVGVDAAHPFYGKPYDECDVDVHGGLTYASKCDGSICHVPEAGMPEDVWWLGFDCGHAGDLSPRMLALELEMPELRKFAKLTMREDTYRDLAYVKAETEALARQLRELTSVCASITGPSHKNQGALPADGSAQNQQQGG